MFEGCGGREVTWGIGCLQEDWKETCTGFRTAWSETQPEEPSWQLYKPAQTLLFPTGENPWLLLLLPYPLLLEYLPWKKKAIAFSAIVTRQQSNIYYSFEVIQKTLMRTCLIAQCWLETETCASLLSNRRLNHSIPAHLSGAQTMMDTKIASGLSSVFCIRTTLRAITLLYTKEYWFSLNKTARTASFNSYQMMGRY